MTRKEKMELLLTKVQENDQEAFIADLRQIKTREDIPAILEKYHIVLTEDEKAVLIETDSYAVSDEELDQVAGGCSWCNAYCS